MYRKILFISVNFIKDTQIFTKAAILISFSAISVVLQHKYKPFVLAELNTLELYSNLAVFATMFGGALYVQTWNNDAARAFLFFVILMVNTWFAAIWVFSCFEHFFFVHFKCLFKFFPKFTRSFIIMNEALNSTHFNVNVFKYGYNLYTKVKTLSLQYNHNSFESSPSYKEAPPSYKEASPALKSSMTGLKSLKTKIVKIGEQGFSEKVETLKNGKN